MGVVVIVVVIFVARMPGLESMVEVRSRRCLWDSRDLVGLYRY